MSPATAWLHFSPLFDCCYSHLFLCSLVSYLAVVITWLHGSPFFDCCFFYLSLPSVSIPGSGNFFDWMVSLSLFAATFVSLCPLSPFLALRITIAVFFFFPSSFLHLFLNFPTFLTLSPITVWLLSPHRLFAIFSSFFLNLSPFLLLSQTNTWLLLATHCSVLSTSILTLNTNLSPCFEPVTTHFPLSPHCLPLFLSSLSQSLDFLVHIPLFFSSHYIFVTVHRLSVLLFLSIFLPEFSIFDCELKGEFLIHVTRGICFYSMHTRAHCIPK